MIDTYITGANGFIGSRLYQKLSGETVAIWHDAIQVHQLHEFKRFFFLSTYGNMADHSEAHKILKANCLDLGRVLYYAAQMRIPCESFVFVSSSSVALDVQTPYSRTKLAAEQMMLAMPIPGCIIRPYSVTGIGEQPGHLIPTLIRSCLEGELMKLVPGAVHDYVNVDDVVNGLIAFAKKKTVGTFEFGSGEPTTNAQVLELVEEACGKKANVEIVENLRPYDNKDWFCKNVAPKELGWNPKKTLKQSITEMVKAYKKERLAKAA